MANRLLVTGCKLFEVAVVETEGCKWTETSHAAAKWQFWGREGRKRGGGIRGSEKGYEDGKGRDGRSAKVGFRIACYEPVV